MSEDFLTFEEELLSTTREAIDYSNMYLQARKENKSAYNALQALIYKAGLHTSKKSVENKIIELLSSPYGKEAQEMNEKMNEKEAEYKGLELVCKAYLAHASALQSIIKTQISGEMSEIMKNKYGGNRDEFERKN